MSGTRPSTDGACPTSVRSASAIDGASSGETSSLKALIATIWPATVSCARNTGPCAPIPI